MHSHRFHSQENGGHEDLAEAYGYLPKPKCSHNAPPVCGYCYDGETAQLAFYICAEHSPGIRAIRLHRK